MGKVWVSRLLPRGEVGRSEVARGPLQHIASTYPLLCVRHTTHVRVCACIVSVIIVWRVLSVLGECGWAAGLRHQLHLDTCQKTASGHVRRTWGWLCLVGISPRSRPGGVEGAWAHRYNERHILGRPAWCACGVFVCVSVSLLLPPRLPSSVGFAGRGEPELLR